MEPTGAPEATNIPIANGPRNRKYKGKTIIYFFFSPVNFSYWHKKQINFRISRKTKNRKSGRFEVNTANDNFTDEKKKMAKKTQWTGGASAVPKNQHKKMCDFLLTVTSAKAPSIYHSQLNLSARPSPRQCLWQDRGTLE